MKKLSYLIVLALILGLVLTGCSLLSNISQVPATEQSGISYLTKGAGTEEVPEVIDLIAGQNITVGTVSVWNDFESLYIKYETTGDWVMTETHLAVVITTYRNLPMTKTGNPKVGKFPYKCCYDEMAGNWVFEYPPSYGAVCNADGATAVTLTEITYAIPLMWGVGAKLFIAAHAVVQNNSVAVDWDIYGEPISWWTETAWGAGFDFSGKNWATYFKYTVQSPLTLDLYEKTPLPLTDPPTPWPIVEDGASGQLKYYPFGFTFNFVFNGYDLKGIEGTGYTLIYYPDPWPGNGLICLGEGTTNADGDVYIAGSVDTAGDLPTGDDEVPLGGAKIWLVLTDDINCGVSFKNVWNPTEYLFEGDVITFVDAD
jgi:hypothetical protein